MMCLMLICAVIPVLCDALMQTKGVKSIVSIKPEDAAWYAAIGGGAAAVVGSAIAWPLMRKLLKQYDETHTLPKDAEGKTTYKTSGVEEDR
jgi:hypothetical protein